MIGDMCNMTMSEREDVFAYRELCFQQIREIGWMKLEVEDKEMKSGDKVFFTLGRALNVIWFRMLGEPAEEVLFDLLDIYELIIDPSQYKEFGEEDRFYKDLFFDTMRTFARNTIEKIAQMAMGEG